jgi:hypothetical protein
VKLGTEKHREALRTDQAWSAELYKAFGRQAGDKRYTMEGRGKPGTALRAAYDARTTADQAWHDEGTGHEPDETLAAMEQIWGGP